ncbi:hypothetical protein LGH70_15275 [Hymenobacter sp. BT635]|uniref:Outer membrane protein beta-barrel domain-containing protein n=1 Tax=Hymenobacter nitidus TaxID=2880929 RepID=A0ABS8AFC8_9BACT|nr:hypothetical protein [Hymenobacter nitidus]MCB2378961.1 hypothetical protein [Hymenobacter nitidus]
MTTLFAFCRYPKLLPGLALLLTLGFNREATAQTDSLGAQPKRRPATTFSIGGSGGVSEQYYKVRSYAKNAPVPETYQQRYQVAGFGMARTLPILRRSTLTLELQGAAGQTRLYANKPDQATTRKLYSLSPYVEIGHPQYFRLGLGAHLGHAAYDFVYKPEKRSTARLQVLVEGGRFSLFYVHASFNRGLLGLGNGTAVFGLGSGFGSTRHRLLLGAAVVNSEANASILSSTTSTFIPVAQAHIGLGSHWELEPHLASNFQDVYQARLLLNYRLTGRTTR